MITETERLLMRKYAEGDADEHLRVVAGPLSRRHFPATYRPTRDAVYFDTPCVYYAAGRADYRADGSPYTERQQSDARADS